MRRLSPEQIKKLPRKEKLTDGEIHKLAHYWANGLARKLTLAVHIKDELAQEAALGILRAIQLYKPARGSIITYANLWAFAYMRKHVNKLGSAVGYGGGMPDTGGKMPEFITEPPEHTDIKKRLAEADERTRDIIRRKVSGETLEQIGQHYTMSREAVRKICYRFLRSAVDDEGSYARLN